MADPSLIIGPIEQSAREYWSRRQKHASSAPSFALTQDPMPLPIVPVSFKNSVGLSIPIRLDIEAEGLKLREAFFWRPDDPFLDPNTLATELCAEFDLPPIVFTPLITQSLSEQVQDHLAFTEARRGTSFGRIHALIKIDIVIGLLQYIDNIPVDLGEDPLTVQAYSEQTTRELALPMEFGPALWFSICEQVYQLQRALLAAGWTIESNGKLVLNSSADPELSARIIQWPGPILRSIPEQGPIITELSSIEVEKLEIAREREGRRKRRQGRTRRDAWALGSPPKLHRTALSYKGSLVRKMEASEESENDREDKDDEVYRAPSALLAQTSSGRGGRRKRGRGRGRR